MQTKKLSHQVLCWKEPLCGAASATHGPPSLRRYPFKHFKWVAVPFRRLKGIVFWECENERREPVLLKLLFILGDRGHRRRHTHVYRRDKSPNTSDKVTAGSHGPTNASITWTGEIADIWKRSHESIMWARRCIAAFKPLPRPNSGASILTWNELQSVRKWWYLWGGFPFINFTKYWAILILCVGSARRLLSLFLLMIMLPCVSSDSSMPVSIQWTKKSGLCSRRRANKPFNFFFLHYEQR